MNPADLTEAEIADWLKARLENANCHGLSGGTVSASATQSGHVLFSLMAWTGETHIHASGSTLAEVQAAFSKQADPALRDAALRAAADKLMAQTEVGA